MNVAPAWPLSVTRTKVVKFARASTAGFFIPRPGYSRYFFTADTRKRVMTNFHIFIKVKHAQKSHGVHFACLIHQTKWF